jgi:hypothetical protein
VDLSIVDLVSAGFQLVIYLFFVLFGTVYLLRVMFRWLGL